MTEAELFNALSTMSWPGALVIITVVVSVACCIITVVRS